MFGLSRSAGPRGGGWKEGVTKDRSQTKEDGGDGGCGGCGNNGLAAGKCQL